VDTHTPLPGLNIQSFERMSDEEFWNYARQRVNAVPELPAHSEYLECRLSSNGCLVVLRDLAEVLPPPHRLARLPGMPIWMAGIMAWRGETVAVVDLDCYLLGSRDGGAQTKEGMLLMASSKDSMVGLLVPSLGLTSTIAPELITAFMTSHDPNPADDIEIIEGIYADLPILNICALLTRLVQQIRMATYHG